MSKLSIILLLSTFISGTSQASLILTPPPPSTAPMTDVDAAVSLGDFPADRGGITVGNGGFSVQCSENGPLQSYDFLVTQNELGGKFKVSPVNTTEESLYRVSSVIHAKLPALAVSFDIFTYEILNGDTTGTYVWQAGSPWASADLPAESGHEITPCSDNQNPIPYYVRQVVLRKYVKSSYRSQIVLQYDPLLYYQLPDVQRSFLLVHEWLWNFTKDNQANSKADYLLHSTWIEKASQEDVIKTFKKLGIKFPGN